MSCPACGGALEPWREVAAGEPADPARYPLLRCGDCGSAVTGGERPGSAAYEEGMYAPGKPRLGWLVQLFQRLTVGQPVRMLRRAGLPDRARVLDAGAGPGRLVGALRAAGHEASGIEPSARSVASAIAAGQPVRRHSIELYEDSGLDAAVLWHVLEHLDRPSADLAKIRGWLRPGGLLLVGVPNLRSWQARIGGAGWLHFDAPRHRVHYTPAGLEALLDRCGFDRIRTAHLVWEQNPHAMWMSMLARLGMTPGFPFHVLKRNVRARPWDVALLVLGLPLLPIALLLEAAAAAARRGGTIAVVARAR